MFHIGRQRLGIFGVGLAVTAAVALLYVARPAGLEFQDLKVYDLLSRRERETVRSGLPVIVDIDERSLAKYGQWPWPRYRVALLLGLLRNAGVAAVGLDMVFAEPDRTSPALLAAQLKSDLKIDVEISGLPDRLRDFDDVLANLLRGAPVTLGYYFDFPGQTAADGYGGRIAGDAGEECRVPRLNISLMRAQGAGPITDSLSRATGVVCPLPNLLRETRAAGFFNAVTDGDNILRRSPLLISWRDGVYPSLALATVMTALGAKNAVVKLSEVGLEYLSLQAEDGQSRRIPLDAHGRVLINYRGPGGQFPVVSAADVLGGAVKKEALAGKIVYVGTSAAGLRDLRATPADPAMPGVEVHATVTDMIMSGDFIQRPDYAPGLEVMTAVAVGILSAALLAWTRAVFLLVPFVGLAASLWFGAGRMLSHGGVYLSPLYPLLVLALNFTLLTFLKFWREERQKRFIHTAFSRYLAPTVVERIVRSPESLTLTGEEREVTILFSDVRGFTTLSENLTPTQVVELLHQYLTPMTRRITDNLGTLDKFIGDAIMAFWNAPVDVPRHQTAALRTALAMLDDLARLNVGFRQRYNLSIDIGIGLHTGRVRVGNFGSEDLFDYTVIGDAVNLCSRLEGLTKFYGLRLLVSEAMRQAAGEGFVFVEVDQVRVKGKNEPVTIHTVLTPEAYAARQAEIDRFVTALGLYKARDFVAARTLFDDLTAAGGETLYALYAERAAALAADPPSPDWDGVFTHTKK